MKRFTTFFIIILFFPYILRAQNSSEFTPLTYGMNHEDHISELGEVDYYSFQATAGDVIMLRMRDETKVDSYIKLYDPDGEMIASSWSDGGLAKIRNQNIDKTGTYKIHAYDRNHNDVGKYGLSLHKLDNSNYATQISELTSFEDNIEQIVGVNMYRFKAEKGDILFTQMRAQTVHLECEFYIYNSAGDEVFKAENKGRLATVGPVPLQESDTYTIVVTDRGGNDMDKFGLTHMLLNKHELAPQLLCGDNKTDNLNKLVQRNAFRLEARAGQIPLVEARSNNTVLETTMMIYDEKGNIIRKKSSTNKLISELLPAQDFDKSYLVVVFDRNGNDFGDFGIQVQFLDESFCPSVLNCSNQEEDITLDGLAQSQVFSIEGQAGEPVNVLLKETDPLLEPHLRMFSLKGELIADEYDGVKADLSDHVFPNNEKYLILASDRSGNDLGTFTLNAPASGDLALDINPCQTVYRGYTEEMSFADIAVQVSGPGLQYLWSNGETTQGIHVCPLESETFSVTVTNSSGCSGTISTFVEVVDVSCGNNPWNPKVEVCHVKDNGQHQTKCISVNGVWEHLNNGNGHEECHIGPCDHVSPCDEGSGQDIDTETATRSGENEALVFPNPTSSYVNVALQQVPAKDLSIMLYDASGQRLMLDNVENNGQELRYDLKSMGLNPGVYFISMSGEEFSDTKQIILLK